MKNHISRRQFLINSVTIIGACLLPLSLFKRAIEYQTNTNDVLIEAPSVYKRTLYINKEFSDEWQFSIGKPTTVLPQAPTWREYLEVYEGINPNNSRQISDWLHEHPDTIEDVEEEWLDDDVDYSTWENYLDWVFAIKDSPEARSFHYLSKLKRNYSDYKSNFSSKVGELSFYSGPTPGNNSHFVNATSDLIITTLQNRLLELGEETRIMT